MTGERDSKHDSEDADVIDLTAEGGIQANNPSADSNAQSRCAGLVAILGTLTGNFTKLSLGQKIVGVIILRGSVFVFFAMPLSLGFAEKNSVAFNSTIERLYDELTNATGDGETTWADIFFPVPVMEGFVASMLPNFLLNGETTRLLFFQWLLENYERNAAYPQQWYTHLLLDLVMIPVAALPTLLYSRALFNSLPNPNQFSFDMFVVYLQTAARLNQMHHGILNLPENLKKKYALFRKKAGHIKAIYACGAALSFFGTGLSGYESATFIPLNNGSIVFTGDVIDYSCKQIASLSIDYPAAYGAIKITAGLTYSFSFFTHAVTGVALSINEFTRLFKGRGFFLQALVFACESGFTLLEDYFTADDHPSQSAWDNVLSKPIIGGIIFGVTVAINQKAALYMLESTSWTMSKLFHLCKSKAQAHFFSQKTDGVEDNGQALDDPLLDHDADLGPAKLDGFRTETKVEVAAEEQALPTPINSLAWLAASLLLALFSPSVMVIALVQFAIVSLFNLQVTVTGEEPPRPYSQHMARLRQLPGPSAPRRVAPAGTGDGFGADRPGRDPSGADEGSQQKGNRLKCQ
jgi:hypothetical protein